MMDIKPYILLFVILTGLIGCKDTERPNYNNELGQFVRFAFPINNDGEQIEEKLLQNVSFSDTFNHRSFYSVLKVPVALTSEPLSENLLVNFSTEVSGSYSTFWVSPENMLTFKPGQYYDTIYVEFEGRWDDTERNHLSLKLESTSNQNVTVGNQFSGEVKNDVFTILLSAVKMRMQLASAPNVTILGEKDETTTIAIEFPDGMLASELDTLDLLEVVESDFNYALEKTAVNELNNKVYYSFTNVDDIQVDHLRFSAKLRILENAYYELVGSQSITISKDSIGAGSASINTAANFYNLEDMYYRNYGENWMYDAADDLCEWVGFNTFSIPVIVDKNHPKAVLHDQGTPDTSDDMYYHAFRIGFQPPPGSNTTNSFNLKRWFNNYSTNVESSPGFNITQALEFSPLNDTSTTEGTVTVIEQDLVVGATQSAGGKQYTLSISGGGVYKKLDSGIVEISFTLNVFNNELFGGTQTSYYKLYNSKNYVEPELIEESCVMKVDL